MVRVTLALKLDVLGGMPSSVALTLIST
jgi:hypothetical protein